MRLVCPNCDAEYEVGEGMIPSAGRDVQCSNCELVWFQAGAAASADLPEAVAPPPPAPKRRKLDDAARAVIESEVEFETKAREQDAKRAVEDTRPDIAPTPRPPKKPVIETDPDDDKKFDRFQDVEEINSALPDAPVAEKVETQNVAYAMSPQQRRARGFRSGFGLTLIVAAGLLMAYANAPLIAQRAPHLTTSLASYVRSVDTVRVWLDNAALGMTERMGNLVENVSADS